MNFSHGSYEEHGERITNVRASHKAEPMGGRLVGIALDTKGPEIRTGTHKEGDRSSVQMTKGAVITVTVNPAFKKECTAELLHMDYLSLPKDMEVGGTIFVDDGLLNLKVVEKVDAQTLKCEVMNSAELGSNKGCNLPEVDVDLPALSEKDKADLTWGVGQNVHMVFASFIRKAQDVRDVRACLVAADPQVGARIRIISKIESHEGMRNFDEILAETDGVMVARGDLGIEIPPEKVFLAQKMMIAKCNMAGKPIICATQMLESMTGNPRPTRAEVSDVANAVLDGADCTMLSGETAKGKYPREAVDMMARINREAEAVVFHAARAAEMSALGAVSGAEAVAKAAVAAATAKQAALVVVVTADGTAARLVSKWRPRCPVVVLALDEHVGGACNLHRGCLPFLYEPAGGALKLDASLARGIELAKQNELVKPGQPVVFVHGSATEVDALSAHRVVEA